MNYKGVPLIGIPNHLNWLTFAREPCLSNDYPRVNIYINVRLSFFHFSLQKYIINHKDILLTLFFNDNVIFWIMNIYSDSSHSALKYLKNTGVNIINLLIMTGYFNIRDSIILFNPLIIPATNCGPLSEITLSGNPCNFHTLSLNSLANPFTVIFSVITTKWDIFENLSHTTKIES